MTRATEPSGTIQVGSESRRKFLAFSAVGLATGILEACSDDSAAPNAASVGGGGPGGAGSGGASSGGASSGGVSSSTGGTLTGGTSTGGTSTGGTAAGGASTGGTSTGGTAAGGASGGAAGGGQATGGANGGGGAAQAGGGAGGTSAGSGGVGGSGVTGGAPAGGSGGGGSLMGGKEDNGATCSVGTPPAFADTTSSTILPDLFKMLSGTRITSKDQWNCLRADLMATVEACIYGPKMPPPDMLTASLNGSMLSINMQVGGQMGSFSVSISGGGSAANPVPCLITCGGSSLPALSGVATITLPNQNIASESGTSGTVHSLYGNAASQSGALIGWAWGLSRIIDALEQVPEAGIDVKRIAVTGCSRNGKGALAMGAFDERVALTIPQEGGSGGPAVWRVADAEYKMGQNIQEAGEIIGEARWTGEPFKQYANNRANVNRLPADQHTVIALCAPRAVLVIDNDIDWLGPVACYAGGKAASRIYQGLGIADRCGVSVSSNHGHCQFPSGQRAYLDAFVNRFLKGMSADTSGVDELNTSSTTSKLRTFDEGTWMDWDVPALSGNLAWDPFA